ncbi:MAG TPA: TIGR03936 family radical SAM-associated protein [Candidatus Acidoferrum sp.]|nr:TIGR03936 family radical SAM-associated protein [Candidatus Acidoferrum sp.]
MKLYFMIGLPTETQADLDELVRVARESARIARRERARGFGLTVSASSFVPKPHTPFQWFAQDPMEVLQQKQDYLKARLREARIAFKWHGVEASFLEAVFALGGRELGAAIALAQERGCRFDGWTEELQFNIWMEALTAAGVDPYAIANRPRELAAPLLWDHIDCGLSKSFLEREYHRAMQGKGTLDCHAGPCNNCGEICAPSWRRWAEDSSEGLQAGTPPGEGSAGSEGARDVASGAAAAPPAMSNAVTQPLQKIRFEFHKVGDLRYLSHLELMRALQRALRRADLPLAYTQGFNPQPKISLAQALAVGVEALREPGELELTRRVDPTDLLARWNRQLPPELKILRAWEAPLLGPSLSAGVRDAVYQIRLQPNGWDAFVLAELGTTGACAAFLAREPIPVEASKKGRPVTLDARPFIHGFSATTEGGSPVWELVLQTGLGGSVKPQAVMRSFLGGRVPPGELDLMVSSLRVTRTALALEGQG